MRKVGITAYVLILFILTFNALSQEGWEPLFNGKDLSGWKVIGDQEWAVKDGAIITTASGKEMGWLVTEQRYTNFVLSLQFKWRGGNSGVQIRSKIEDEKMIGYQANLDPSRDFATGALLEENGRGMIQDNTIPASDIFKKNDWNTYEITAIGSHIVVKVNGSVTAACKDPDGMKTGVIALQMAPGENAGLEWKDIRIVTLDD